MICWLIHTILNEANLRCQHKNQQMSEIHFKLLYTNIVLWKRTDILKQALISFSDYKPRLPSWLSRKESACNAEDKGLILWFGWSPGNRNGNTPQYSWLGNPMDRGTKWAIVLGVTKNRTWLSNYTPTAVKTLLDFFTFIFNWKKVALWCVGCCYRTCSYW